MTNRAPGHQRKCPTRESSSSIELEAVASVADTCFDAAVDGIKQRM